MTAAAPIGAPRTEWTAAAAATLAGIAAAMQVGKSAAALPLIRAEMGADLVTLGAYAALISAVAASAGIVFGGAAQAVGLRRAGVLGLGLIVAGAVGGALAGGPAALMASRVPEALGFALVATAMPALIQSVTAPRDRSLALGLWATWLPVGISAAMLAALAGPAIGWRGVFWLCAAVPALAALLLLAAAPPRAAGPAPRWRAPTRDALVLAAVFSAFSAANLVVVAFLPTILFDDLGLSPARGALVALCANLALVPTNLGAGWLRGRGAGGRRLTALGLAGMGAAAAALFAGALPGEARIGAALLYGACCGVPPAVIWGSIPLVARGPDGAPVASGLLYQGAGIGQIAGPLAAAWAVEGAGSWDAALWVIAAALALAGALLVLLPGRLYAR